MPLVAGILKDARMATGLSQRQLAAQVGCSFQTISSMEAGKVVSADKYLDKIVEVLELDRDDFFARVCLDRGYIKLTSTHSIASVVNLLRIERGGVNN